MRTNSSRRPLKFLLLNLFAISTTFALHVAPGSGCASVCTTGSSSNSKTDSSQVVCHDSQYTSTAAGSTFQSCLTCLLKSKHVDSSSGESDQSWALYNLRYAFDTCVYGFPDANASSSNPCVISCTPIQQSLQFGVKFPTPSQPFDYCNDGTFMSGIGQCTFCYSILQDQKYLASFLNVLQIGCEEQPAIGVELTNVPNPFSPNPIATASGNLILPTGAPSATVSAVPGAGGPHSTLALGAKIGIGLGVLVGFILIVACCTITISRRRKRLRNLQAMDRSPWVGSSPPIPPPHSPAYPITNYARTFPTYHPYSDASPVDRQKETSPITPLERIFYPKGFATVREDDIGHEMQQQTEKPRPPPQGGFVWPEQERRLKLQTQPGNWQGRNPAAKGSGMGRREDYSADGKEISPLSFP